MIQMIQMIQKMLANSMATVRMVYIGLIGQLSVIDCPISLSPLSHET